MREKKYPPLKRYRDVSGNSGIESYAPLSDDIFIKFKSGDEVYHYDSRHPGRKHVKQMQKLAASGNHLATYINQNVRGNYAEKLSKYPPNSASN